MILSLPFSHPFDLPSFGPSSPGLRDSAVAWRRNPGLPLTALCRKRPLLAPKDPHPGAPGRSRDLTADALEVCASRADLSSHFVPDPDRCAVMSRAVDVAMVRAVCAGPDRLWPFEVVEQVEPWTDRSVTVCRQGRCLGPEPSKRRGRSLLRAIRGITLKRILGGTAGIDEGRASRPPVCHDYGQRGRPPAQYHGRRPPDPPAERSRCVAGNILIYKSDTTLWTRRSMDGAGNAGVSPARDGCGRRWRWTCLSDTARNGLPVLAPGARVLDTTAPSLTSDVSRRRPALF